MPGLRLAVAGALLLAHLGIDATIGGRGPVEVLQSSGALPPHISGRFEDPIGYAQATTGEYVVLDRRAHTMYVIDAKRTAARKVLEIGFKKGEVASPGAMTISRDDIVAVADAPGGLERIQYFDLNGLLLGGFYLQTRVRERIVVGPLVLNGVGSMTFTGRTFLVSRPETGALFQEIDLHGTVLRQIGHLRATGHEGDPDLHLALNTGLALADPRGGFVFVFQTGIPLFRRYSAEGDLIAERHIEGPELDAAIRSRPTSWPSPTERRGSAPYVEPLVQTAAIDRGGRMWVSLTAPYTYVYAPDGDKQRTIQFRGTEIFAARSLAFTPKGDRVLVTPGCYEFSTANPHEAMK
jgi:hypothetical protein